MSWCFATAIRNLFNVRFAPKTKVKRFKEFDDQDFHEVAGAETGLKEKTAFGEKWKRGKSYAVNGDACKRETNVFVTWKQTLVSGKRQVKKNEEVSLSSSLTSAKKEDNIVSYDFARRDSYQKRDTKTEKEIKSDSIQPVFSELFEICQSSFVNELAPPIPVTLYGRQSYTLIDPAIVLEEAKDIGVPTNHVSLNVSAGNAWEETRNRTTIKSTLTNFFGRFKRQNKSKVRKV